MTGQQNGQQKAALDAYLQAYQEMPDFRRAIDAAAYQPAPEVKQARQRFEEKQTALFGMLDIAQVHQMPEEAQWLQRRLNVLEQERSTLNAAEQAKAAAASAARTEILKQFGVPDPFEEE